MAVQNIKKLELMRSEFNRKVIGIFWSWNIWKRQCKNQTEKKTQKVYTDRLRIQVAISNSNKNSVNKKTGW